MEFRTIQDPSPVWDRIESRMMDDGGFLVEDGQFIGAFDGITMAAAFLLKPWNGFCYEIHGGVVPEYFGKGKDICHELGKAIFSSTPCLKILAIIPEYNRLMRKCVQGAGMSQEGIIKKAFVKWMKAHDLYVYGVTRGEAMKCHL